MKKTDLAPASNIDFKTASQTLVDLIANIAWVEEGALKQGPFSALTVRDVHTIYAISMYEEKTASQLAKAVHLSPSAMTTAIDRLVQKGYVERRRSKTDRRVVKLGLTHQGRILYRAHRAFHMQLTKAMFTGFSEDAAEVLEKALGNLKNYLQDLLKE
ncbi:MULTISPECIES: MarR family winged helix-turn-helix transcriptional regulator [Fructobacillus]|uniref:DNA-binding transcriptional regulator, MarR family n=1 Tax=Fructobacillus durionis TaxID=283737 RepID=A0A1I1GMF5_9LACO|nr:MULTISPECIES: MarR family transcriptional regulator [Fructobacillus]MDD9138033.1 MarR family transcriptional regulator [Fructobacillus sp. CRL 2054]SFC11058.1 DNA-binding transcriptional regulator, MarR family [Fructobacillus durionis]